VKRRSRSVFPSVFPALSPRPRASRRRVGRASQPLTPSRGYPDALTQPYPLLRRLVDDLDLSQREYSQLEPAVRGLQRMVRKLEADVVQIAVFGLVGRGKSSLLNALVGQEVFQTGATHGVTQQIKASQWQVESLALETLGEQWYPQDFYPGSSAPLSPEGRGWGDPSGESFPQGSPAGGVATAGSLARRSWTTPWMLGPTAIEFVDTPGLDEVGGEERERLARRVAKRVDLILFVVSGDITQVEYEALLTLRQASKPMILVFNKVDQYPDLDRQAIYEKIRDDRLRDLISPEEIVMAAAAPLVTTAQRRPDGRVTLQRQPGPSQVQELKYKILDLLQREGKALMALNALIYADAAHRHIVQRKMELREQAADQLIWNAAVTKAVAVAVNPFTLLDMVSGAAIDVFMILSLARLYGLPLTERGAVTLLQRIALGMGGLAAGDLLTHLSLSSLKGLLGAAAPVTGGATLVPYIPVATTQAALAGLCSYGIGRVTKTYLAQGATWGNDSPRSLAQRLLGSLDEASVLARLRQELQRRID
jgi:GTPase